MRKERSKRRRTSRSSRSRSRSRRIFEVGNIQGKA